MADFIRARESFVAARTGDEPQRVVTEGTVLAADDPVVAGREPLFETVEDVVEREAASLTAPRPDPAAEPRRRPRQPGKARSKAASSDPGGEG